MKLTRLLFRSRRLRALGQADNARDRGEPARAALLYRGVIKRWGCSFEILVQLGNALKDSGDYVAAESVYLEALSLRPEDADVFLQRGHLMKLVGDIDQALEMYRRANRLDPHRGDAMHELTLLSASAANQIEGSKLVPKYGSPPGRDGLSMQASIVYARMINQYKWRRE